MNIYVVCALFECVCVCLITKTGCFLRVFCVVVGTFSLRIEMDGEELYIYIYRGEN